jgi:hypothetical protein
VVAEIQKGIERKKKKASESNKESAGLSIRFCEEKRGCWENLWGCPKARSGQSIGVWLLVSFTSKNIFVQMYNGS